MAIPVALRPTFIRRVFDLYTDFVPYLQRKYFPFADNPIIGPDIVYDMVTGDRTRPFVVARGAPPDYQDPDAISEVCLPGETMRDGARISAEVLLDYRGIGEDAMRSRGGRELTRRQKQLARRYNRFLEWQAAAGLQGVKEFRPPSARDIHYDELLLCATTCLSATVTTAWNAASATEAAARTNLAGIRTDLITGVTAITNGSDCAPNTLLLNTVTLGLLDTQCIAAGYESGFSDTVISEGHIRVIAGLEIDVYDATYIHPMTSASVKYIPDGVAIILDSDNDRSGRRIMQAQPLHIDAAEGDRGVYFSAYKSEEPPGEWRQAVTWTGAPVCPYDCGSYIFQDITAT